MNSHVKDFMVLKIEPHKYGGFFLPQELHTTSSGIESTSFTYSMNSAGSSGTSGPIGLKLKKSHSQLQLLETELSEIAQREPEDGEGLYSGVAETRGPFGGLQGSIERFRTTATASKPSTRESKQIKARMTASACQRIKASNFAASTLQIGKWKCVAKHEGEITTKCYYAKKKLVWEILEHGVKKKIEINWDDITSFKYSMPRNRSAFIELEVSKVPTFFQESVPQPRRHTTWYKCEDFTDKQATLCRPHRLFFAPGVLNKHIDRLLRCDSRLRQIAERHGHFSERISVGSRSDTRSQRSELTTASASVSRR